MMERASREKQHDFLADLLIHYYRGVIDFAFRNGVVLLAITGWVISSDAAQAFLASSVYVRIIGSSFAVAYTVFHAVWIYKWYSKSNDTFEYLKELAFMDERYYNGQRIQPYMAIMFIALHALVVALIVVLVNSTPSLVG